MKKKLGYQIAIIGMGPKGLYGLERILAQIKHMDINLAITIHLFNKTPFFGAGDIYRPDQPDYLLMNFTNRNIDIRPKDHPPPIIPLKNFVDWIHQDESPIKDPEYQFSSRATVGKYLIDGFTNLINNLPQGVTIRKYIGEVIDLVPEGECYTVAYQLCGKQFILPQKVHKILLTTGHAGNKPFKTGFPDSPAYVDYLYPVKEKLTTIQSGSKLGIKGIGLTFIDAVLALTEGRGGRFQNHGSKLSYAPSGQEPKTIFPFSRSGLPMIPKTSIQLPMTIRYFNQKRISDLRDPFSKQFNFHKNILPEIKKEIYYQYYRMLFHNQGLKLNFYESFDKVRQQVIDFHKCHPKCPVFTFEKLKNPIPGPHNHKAVSKYLKETIHDISNAGPIAAASTVWSKISPVFNKFYSFGGLDALSHEIFDREYFGLFNRISYGPPIANMKKILALTECGYLDFTFSKSPTLNCSKDNKFYLNHSSIKHPLMENLDYLIDARIPKTNLKSTSKIFEQLIKRNLINPYRNVSKNYSYEPGCIDINRNGHPILRNNVVLKNITLYGTPTEGITFDNDTLSRVRNDMVSHWAKETIQEAKNNYTW